MAEFYVKNNLSPGKAIKCTVAFRQIINKDEEGEPVWVVEIGTLAQHKEGGPIPPVFIHYTDALNLDEAIRDATEVISSQVDWSPLLEDLRSPFVKRYSPMEKIVDIHSNVSVDIKDVAPSAGIDSNSIRMTVNGFDVTDELELRGNPFNYSVLWRPFLRVLGNE